MKNENTKKEQPIISDDTIVITQCPCCGQDITASNDAGNGFCLDCTRKGLDD